jgi:hypothetical protein
MIWSMQSIRHMYGMKVGTTDIVRRRAYVMIIQPMEIYVLQGWYTARVAVQQTVPQLD